MHTTGQMQSQAQPEQDPRAKWSQTPNGRAIIAAADGGPRRNAQVPLDVVKGVHGDIYTGSCRDDADVKGYLRVRAGSPLATEALERRLEGLGLAYGGDGSNEIVDDDGTLWVPLHELWPDDDSRWLLTEAGEAVAAR